MHNYSCAWELPVPMYWEAERTSSSPIVKVLYLASRYIKTT